MGGSGSETPTHFIQPNLTMSTQPITDADVREWFESKAKATGISGIMVGFSTYAFHAFQASCPGVPYCFGDTMDAAIEKLKAMIPKPEDTAAKQRAEAAKLQAEAARLLAEAERICPTKEAP